MALSSRPVLRWRHDDRCSLSRLRLGLSRTTPLAETARLSRKPSRPLWRCKRVRRRTATRSGAFARARNPRVGLALHHSAYRASGRRASGQAGGWPSSAVGCGSTADSSNSGQQQVNASNWSAVGAPHSSGISLAVCGFSEGAAARREGDSDGSISASASASASGCSTALAFEQD